MSDGKVAGTNTLCRDGGINPTFRAAGVTPNGMQGHFCSRRATATPPVSRIIARIAQWCSPSLRQQAGSRELEFARKETGREVECSAISRRMDRKRCTLSVSLAHRCRPPASTQARRASANQIRASGWRRYLLTNVDLGCQPTAKYCGYPSCKMEIDWFVPSNSCPTATPRHNALTS